MTGGKHLRRNDVWKTLDESLQAAMAASLPVLFIRDTGFYQLIVIIEPQLWSKRMFGLVKRICLILVLAGTANPAAGDAVNDYPTAARAEYVLGCMAVSGQTPAMLQKCSCSIDFIASVIPYEKYVQMETILRMRQVLGERTAVFRGTMWANSMIDELRSVEAESTLACF